MEPEFLMVADALYIHRNQITTYGGRQGVRDAGLLESAIAQPRASHAGAFLHRDLSEMAAAYLYHVVQNHPFIDGNKRTGAVLALTFLEWNGIRLRPDNEGLVDITLRVASGKAGKHEVAGFFSAIAPSLRPHEVSPAPALAAPPAPGLAAGTPAAVGMADPRRRRPGTRCGQRRY